jgi:hypothetical protein
MSARTIALDQLVGRVVRDADGRRIGRIEELEAELVFEPHGNDYVVTRFGIGRFGILDTIASGRIVQQLVRRLMRATSYVRYEIPWEWMDLSDVAHPRVTRRERELAQTP